MLAFCAFMIAIGYGVVVPALPAFARSFDVGVTAASAIVSAFAVARVVFAPISGRIVGPMGELPVFCGGLTMGSLRAPFLVYAGVLVLTVLVAGSLLRGRVGQRLAPECPTTTTVTFAAAFRVPAFRAALTSNFINGRTVYGVWIALVPLFVVDVVKRPGSWAGVVLAASAAGTGATLLIGGRWADRRGRKLPVLVGSATVAVASLWLGLSGTTAELIAASLLSGVGTGLLNPPVNAAVTDVIVADRRDARGGTALAGFQMVGDVGAIIGPLLAGMIVEWAGYAAAFATTAAIAVISFSYWLRAPEPAPR